MLVKIEAKFVEGKEFLKTSIFSKPLIHLWSKKGGWMNDSIHECWINQKVRIKEKYNVNKNTRKFKMREEFLRGRRKEGKYIIDWYPFVVNILILQNMNTVKCYLLAYKVLKKKISISLRFLMQTQVLPSSFPSPLGSYPLICDSSPNHKTTLCTCLEQQQSKNGMPTQQRWTEYLQQETPQTVNFTCLNPSTKTKKTAWLLQNPAPCCNRPWRKEL